MHAVDSRYAWARLVASVTLSTLGAVGLWGVVVVFPAVQAEFHATRAEVSLSYTTTMLGFGVKFAPPESPIAGQNERSYPVVIQYIDDKPYVVWPKSLVQRDVVLPWPAGMTYSYK